MFGGSSVCVCVCVCEHTAAQSSAGAQGSTHRGVLVNSGAEEFCCLRGKGRPCGSPLEPAGVTAPCFSPSSA